MDVGVGMEKVGKAEDLKFANPQWPELRQRRSQHLHRSKLQCFQLFRVFVQLAVRIDFDFDATGGALLRQLLEIKGCLSRCRIRGYDVAELDSNWLLRHRRRDNRCRAAKCDE